TGDTPPTNEFVVDNAVRVNDYLYLITPFPLVGTNYASLTGILDYRNNDSKIELRGPADVVVGTPTLNAFGPPLTFADLGQTGAPTYPTPLTVQLNAAPANDTFVGITSSDPTSVTVTGGGVVIPAGQTSAPVLIDGLLQTPGV